MPPRMQENFVRDGSRQNIVPTNQPPTHPPHFSLPYEVDLCIVRLARNNRNYIQRGTTQDCGMSINLDFPGALEGNRQRPSTMRDDRSVTPPIPYRQLRLSDAEPDVIKEMNTQVAATIVETHWTVTNKLTEIGDIFFSSKQAVTDEMVQHFLTGSQNSDLDYLVCNMNALPCLFYKLLFEDHKFPNPRSEFSVLRYIIGTDLTKCSVDDLCYILGNVVREVQDLGDDKWNFMEPDMIRQIMVMQNLDKYPNPKLYDGMEYAIGFYLFVSMVDFRVIKNVTFRQFFLKALEWHPELSGSLIGVLEYSFGGILGTKVNAIRPPFVVSSFMASLTISL